MLDGRRHTSPGRTPASRRWPRLGGLLALAALALLAVPAAASAKLLESFSAEVRAADGSLFTQAGGHPDTASTVITFASHDDDGAQVPDESVRNIHVDLPEGLIGNPAAIPQCTRAQLYTPSGSFSGGCPKASQVGIVNVGAFGDLPVHNMVPPKGVPAQFGFIVGIPKVFATASVRADGGLTINLPNTSQALPLTRTVFTFWGIPADHNGALGAPRVPFLTTPTTCTGPVTTTVRANSWQDPTYESLDATTPVGADGCEDLPFDPGVDVQTSSSTADSPTGLSVDVTMPKPQLNPDGVAQAHLRKAVVTLPHGMSLNPAAADGLAGCTEAQVGLDNTDDPRCPRASKIGSVEIASPLVPDPLTGAIYQATPNQNPFDSLIAIYLVARGSGVTVKLAGNIERNPNNGRLTATIDNSPQLPFTRFSLDFKGGQRAPIATAATCGAGTATATLTPWSGTAPVTLQDSVAVDRSPGGGPCATTDAARPFTPELGGATGLANRAAGSSSAFTLQVSRPDGSQEISTIDATLPEGVSAILRGTPRCGEAQAATGTCPESTRVGSVAVSAGAGDPVQITGGRVDMAGPYKGAPLSLAIVVPAKTGIFDLGTVVMRAAVFVDPVDAHLRVASDPIPAILKGIPLRVRSLTISIDKPGFMSSPTSCERQRVSARLRGLSGGGATVAKPFQMSGCSALGFSPIMSTKITGGRKATKRSVNPGLRASLDFPTGPQAHASRVALRLPKVIFLDQANTTDICTRAQYAAEACPKESIYGHATAISPLLNKPLSGPVYLRSSNHTLPDLVADLNGIVDIDLAGRIDTVKRAMRTTFERVPDVPVSHFELRIAGGQGGLLVNSKNLCKGKSKFGKQLVRKARKQKRKAKKLAKRAKQADGKQAKQLKKQARRHKHKAKQQKRRARKHTRAYRSKVTIDGQNGATVKQRPKLKASCGGKGKHKGGKHKHRHHKHFEARAIR